MKSYLQRLAERAKGVSLRPPLIYTVRSKAIRETGSGSFLNKKADESSKTLGDIPHNQPLQYSSETVPPSVQVPLRVRSSHLKSPELAKESSERAAVQPVSASSETGTPQQTPRAFPERSITESRSSAEREQAYAAPIEVQREMSEDKSSPPLSPVHDIDEPFTKGGRGNDDNIRRLDQLAHDVLQRLAPLSQPAEGPPPFGQHVGAAAVSDKPIPNLEPRRTKPIRQITPIPDEPRLVIGQLRVDILPTGPTETREVVRVVQRRAGASRTSRTSPVSKLRFGLGQM
jgi:hypothetical protein